MRLVTGLVVAGEFGCFVARLTAAYGLLLVAALPAGDASGKRRQEPVRRQAPSVSFSALAGPGRVGSAG